MTDQVEKVKKVVDLEFKVLDDVAYTAPAKGKNPGKAALYTKLKEALDKLVPVAEGQPNANAVFVSNTQISFGSLTKQLKALTPEGGATFFKTLKQKDPAGKVVGVRVYKYTVAPAA